MKHHLVFKNSNSDKFWTIETNGSSFTVTYGRTGSAGQTLKKTFASNEICKLEADKLVQEKIKKGYYENSSEPKEPALPITKKKEGKTIPTSKTKVVENPKGLSRSVSLYYQHGGSDKVYHLTLEQSESGFTVNFSFGRRGSTLTSGTKTSKPVSFESALPIFKKIVNEKKAKGYTEGISGTPYVQTSNESRVSGIHCQLANPITEDELNAYITDELFGAQEKMDGNRTLIRKENEKVEGINRKGLIIALPESMHNDALAIPGDFVIDGEAVGDLFYAFDILKTGGKDTRLLPYSERYRHLDTLLKHKPEFVIKLPLHTKTAEKKKLVNALLAAHREGVMFKNLEAPYVAGRPSSKGTQLKYKFYETASVCVEKVNLKRSVSMKVKDNKTWISVGNVTIPPNVDIPSTNDIIEVRYLYAYKGGSLYQPTYLGKRNDLGESDCVISQLKYKREVQSKIK